MVFSSVSFLFYFLPAVALLYAIAPPKARNGVLLVASLLFYTWGSGALVGVLLVSVLVDYVLGFVAARGHDLDSVRLRRLAITGSVVANVGILVWFKYAGWLLTEAADAGVWTGTVPEIVLPIGVSFFTFQSMSYTIDVARGRCEHLVNPLDFALYVTLFPQLIAGPIVRYHEIHEQIHRREHNLANVGEGAIRFAHGLAKKVLVADTVAVVADVAFADASPSAGVAWVGIFAYTVQIYFDFSGYSDMAIGLGKMFGFTFPENFERPYSAVSVTDFWRRWHITLSNWFRDYVYIPLGGGRGAPVAVYRNLLAVFLLTGVWHGANWTFVVWGAYHGSWLLLERRLRLRNTESVRSPAFRRATTLFIVMMGWVLFRAPDLGAAIDYYGALFSFGGFELGPVEPFMTTRVALTLAAATIGVVLLPRHFVAGPALVDPRSRGALVGRALVMLVALPSALLLVASGSFSPFLYFQF
ncbi:MAG: MBOAT family O-acyltransferase [Acidimicrobiales bacterium]